ncbi:MAG: periplasmic heavy metal sensor [Polyangiaceae bacterium]|nr:periplasmic heavy metal sensor [Polyangiaceae bacterium]
MKAKHWAIAGVLSMALNLFLGGVLFGKFFRPDKPPPGIGPISLLRVPPDFDPATKKIIDNSREKHHDEIRRAVRQASTARFAAIDALCATDFDETKAREAFLDFQAKTASAQSAMNDSLVDAAKLMNPEQRALLKDSLVRGASEGRRGRGRGPGGFPSVEQGGLPPPSGPMPPHSLLPPPSENSATAVLSDDPAAPEWSAPNSPAASAADVAQNPVPVPPDSSNHASGGASPGASANDPNTVKRDVGDPTNQDPSGVDGDVGMSQKRDSAGQPSDKRSPRGATSGTRSRPRGRNLGDSAIESPW